MILTAARTSLRSRVLSQLARGGDHHAPSPNGMHLPFNTQKPHFKYTYSAFMALGMGLPFVAAWWQLRKGNGSS
ncbi:hypothetical protein H4219_004499 [Mycoemilia scoparia]|uniref:Cytochrome c oxidase subunit 8, mitochondrial n=1 Tax=Mycoemilia scoparia TaxID=417184 RepID=A0A9W8DLD8_9FUNG|nr:hypothetical protein H4219_004499 [Mycoemilia scoparia]